VLHGGSSGQPRHAQPSYPLYARLPGLRGAPMLLTASLAQSLDSRPQPQPHEVARVLPTRRALVSVATLTAAISAASPSRAELRLPRAARLFEAEVQREVVSVDVGFARVLLGCVVSGGISDDTWLAELQRLQQQEWRYYATARKLALQPPPPLRVFSDADAAGLADPALLNFLLYCRAKVLAKHLPGDAARDAFTRQLGRCLVGESATALPPPQRGSEAALRSSVTALLDWYVRGGYMRSYSVSWGTLPSLPDLPGSSSASQSSVSDAGQSGVPGRCQIRLNAPADLAGCVALRAEQQGWWLRLVPATLGALFDNAGFGADIDEAFFQDVWQSPSKLSDRILLALGDPAGVVEVPFVPDTLALDVTYSARM